VILVMVRFSAHTTFQQGAGDSRYAPSCVAWAERLRSPAGWTRPGWSDCDGRSP